ncbi:hypothetical protein TSTA_110060 [Talaromyces stipitatus ATCC 10500]|uniref:Endonuclease/exonuclease/phosphatase domain-containing protein n=1 Tax=Talaromyces stipitatus (strain ATCC 10500 / CBS 375.48 / QM 6759 / NRRL 1006) TaxID=441959 RepID=B8MUY5_TALSN|nr:uncharacterized protein TSTA_110060 [Talaromyces stipitatus ATCC 10500]EED11826.1 hypothetical protein TSTA_110060 [Talaromyces stipitatus ATCC 10500]
MTRKGPGTDGPLQTALLESTSAATTRASDGQKIFSPIAAFLNKHRSQTTGLAPHLLRALTALSDDLASVAQRHFNAYISGISITSIPPAPPFSPSPTLNLSPPSPPPSRPPSGLERSTYATVTQYAPPMPLVKQPPPDNRLFVRLPGDHAARKMEAYAIYSSLRTQLNSNNSALKEVQATKTDFALVFSSPEALLALKAQKETISAFFVNCQIERSSRWVSYRVTNVPRKIGQISDGRYSLIPVNPTILSSEISEITGLKPISISETTASVANPNTLSSSWFVNFPEDMKTPLPTQLRLFGTITNARYLSKRTVVQCTRCWKWHNARSCARPSRCRLCGSSEHTEGSHVNRCTALEPHQCPPRCIHCHGPHPADSPECLLRPKGNTKHTKAQQAEIRKSCAINLAKARTEGGCSSQLSIGTQETPIALDEMPSQPPTHEIISPFRSVTPPPRAPTEDPPITARAVRFTTPQPQNRYVYNAPAGSIRAGEAAKALSTLPEAYFPQATILAGDLNLLHNRWQPSLNRSSTNFAEPFINWLDLQGLVFISDIDCPTHDRGNVLDLSFASSPLALAGAKASIASHLDATSDHRPLITTVPWDQRYLETAQKLRFDTLDHTCFLSLLTSNLADIESSATTKEDLDALAKKLTSAIQGAYAGSAMRTMSQGIGQPWWNDNCKKASHNYRSGLCSKTDFRRITRRSQRQFWQDKLSTVTQMKDVFDMSKWHKSTGTFRSPPLRDPMRPNSFPAVAVHEKRDVLVRNLLQNLAEAGDIPLDSPAVPSTSLYFPDISMLQVEKSVLHAGNTAPGANEIPTCILKVAWHLIKDKVLMLYQGCLKIGYHPKCFRHAILAIIQKPKKTDCSPLSPG